MTDIVPATTDMMTAFYGRPPVHSPRAFAFVRDERVIGIFGLYADGERMVLFSDLTPELRALKKTLVRGMRFVMALAKEIGVPVHAVPDPDVAGSEQLLTRFGFERVRDDIYECRPATLRETMLGIEEHIRMEMVPVECPVTHHFSKEEYAREMFIKKGTYLTGKIHKHHNFNFMSRGDLSVWNLSIAIKDGIAVWTEEEIKRVRAPFAVVSPPGTKRVAYAHEDSVWTTTHVTDETDLAKIEEYFVAQSESEYIEYVARQEGKS